MPDPGHQRLTVGTTLVQVEAAAKAPRDEGFRRDLAWNTHEPQDAEAAASSCPERANGLPGRPAVRPATARHVGAGDDPVQAAPGVGRLLVRGGTARAWARPRTARPPGARRRLLGDHDCPAR